MSTISDEQNDLFNEKIVTFGDRLQAARSAKGLEIISLAEKLGVDAQAIEDWEKDIDTPRANSIQMLAGLLNVSIVWLISGESNGTSNVIDSYERPIAINDALTEITLLKSTLSAAIEQLEQLEKRLQ